MLIGEVSQQSKLPRDTIRYYEELELIPPARRLENNYKDYPDRVLDDLKMIQLAKGLGFTLKEIRSLVQLMRTNEAPCAQLVDILGEKLAVIQEKKKELDLLESRVSGQIRSLREELDAGG